MSGFDIPAPSFKDGPAVRRTLSIGTLKELAAVAETLSTNDWEVVLGPKGYPQRVVSVGDNRLICECYTNPEYVPVIAKFIAYCSPQRILILLKALEATS
jgi:hypothetical protein